MTIIPSILSFFLFTFSFHSYAKSNQTDEVKIITGEWEVWIPGAVNYIANDVSVYQIYTAGSPMNRLVINHDYSYIWGDKKGNLKQVKPWYAEEGRSYYQISDKNNNTYDFWYKKETDQLIVLFGEVGGHAATGNRWGIIKGQKENLPKSSQLQTTALKSKEVQKDKSQSTAIYNVGEEVSIQWSGSWYKGKILEFNNGKYKVSYDGWGSLYDEWVLPVRLRKFTNN
jgi:hypothetical protein